MANTISLMQYLQVGLPALPINAQVAWGQNTRNDRYGFEDIESVGNWESFNLTTILQRYNHVLTAARLPADPMPASPPTAVASENEIRHKSTQYVTARATRALRAGFNHVMEIGQMNSLTAVTFDVGEAAAFTDNYRPDLAYCDVNQRHNSPNRAPGDFKPSWKWSTALRFGTRPEQKEYKQVLSQLNFYMKQNQARYGLVLTNLELVAIRRLDNDGNLELSASIPWESSGTDTHPRLTVLLALWYLGMLAARDQGPERWQL